ncbi:MAG: CBS domain-containing protein [Deltaproteobacteria bacterium]|nr:CBS domain-containing protein [Deltaproteobacteria bacterium]
MKYVADIMTRDVFPLKAKQTLNVVRLLMRTVNVRHVPILDDQGKFIGLLSHRDLLAYSISKLADIDPLEQSELERSILIGDVMRTEVETTTPETTLREALGLMLKKKFGCLPVIDEKNRLVGIITAEDVIRLALRLLSKPEIAACQESPGD